MPNVWNLYAFMESFNLHTFSDDAENGSGSNKFTYYIVAAQFDLDLNLYDMSKPKAPLIIKRNIGFVATHHWNIISDAYNECGDFIFRHVVQAVAFDNAKDDWMPIPDWWIAKNKPFAKGVSPVVFPIKTIPNGTKAYTVPVTYSDIDKNAKSSWGWHTRHALNGLYHNAKTKILPHFDYPDKRKLKRIENFLGHKTLEGCTLNVFVWVDSTDKNTVHSRIEAYAKGLIIDQCTFVFFEEDGPQSCDTKLFSVKDSFC